jgi:predicted small metal-binding protein
MKYFNCSDVVPGCAASFEAETHDQILAAIAEHASSVHGINDISPALIAQIRANIREDALH